MIRVMIELDGKFTKEIIISTSDNAAQVTIITDKVGAMTATHPEDRSEQTIYKELVEATTSRL